MKGAASSHLGFSSGASELKGICLSPVCMFKKQKQKTQGIVLKCHHTSVRCCICVLLSVARHGARAHVACVPAALSCLWAPALTAEGSELTPGSPSVIARWSWSAAPNAARNLFLNEQIFENNFCQRLRPAWPF